MVYFLRRFCSIFSARTLQSVTHLPCPPFLCCQVDTVAYHFHYSQSLTFYFMLVSPFPQFRCLSTSSVSLPFLYSSPPSSIQWLCTLPSASNKTFVHASNQWPTVWTWAKPEKQKDQIKKKKKSETETAKQGGKSCINRDLVLSNRKSGEPKDRQSGYFSLFLC